MSWLGVNLIELGRTQSSRVNVGANSVGVNSAGANSVGANLVGAISVCRLAWVQNLPLPR